MQGVKVNSDVMQGVKVNSDVRHGVRVESEARCQNCDARCQGGY
jgi:hypothetical protein